MCVWRTSTRSTGSGYAPGWASASISCARSMRTVILAVGPASRAGPQSYRTYKTYRSYGSYGSRVPLGSRHLLRLPRRPAALDRRLVLQQHVLVAAVGVHDVKRARPAL